MKKYLVYGLYALFLLFMALYDVNPVDFPAAAFISVIIIPFALILLILTPIVFINDSTTVSRIMSAFIALASIYTVQKVVHFNFQEEEVGDIVVVSYNASFFRIPVVFSDAYFNPVVPNNNDSSINWLIDQYPDFLLIQEFFDDEGSEYFNNLQKLLVRGRYKDYYFLTDPRHDNGVSRGMVIFSRWPILEKNKIFLDDNRFNGAQEVIVDWAGEKIRIINVHLKSSEFDLAKASQSLQNTKYEIQKLFLDAEIRSEQLQWILDHVKEPYPTIIGGDFNGTRMSYIYKTMVDNYQSSYREAGTGFGFTFKEAFSIPVKLDHQFFSEDFKCTQIYVEDTVKYSDHMPLVGSYTLRRED